MLFSWSPSGGHDVEQATAIMSGANNWFAWQIKQVRLGDVPQLSALAAQASVNFPPHIYGEQFQADVALPSKPVIGAIGDKRGWTFLCRGSVIVCNDHVTSRIVIRPS